VTGPAGTGDPDAAALARSIAGRRWYGAAGETVTAAEVVDSGPVSPSLRWVLLRLGFASGGSATYQLVLDEAGDDAVATPEAVRWLFPSLAAGSVTELAGEQSNTSLVVDGSVIVKVFRRVGEPGEVNPDREIVRALWDNGFRSVPEPVGECVRDGRDLAVARRFLARSSSGWEMALHDPHVLDEVRDLGVVTARMHVALAEAFGSAPGDAASWAAAMRTGAGRVPLPDGLDPTTRYEAVARAGDAGRAVRVHGDYHLGQVLHWRGDWYVLDFEGEPARPVAERTAPSSPLRDVAGMLRSFSYAAAVGSFPPVWEDEARRRFLAGYRSVEAVAALLPADPGPLLAAFELDKAVYEVGYERASRPSWEPIPLAAVRRLLA